MTAVLKYTLALSFLLSPFAVHAGVHPRGEKHDAFVFQTNLGERKAENESYSPPLSANRQLRARRPLPRPNRQAELFETKRISGESNRRHLPWQSLYGLSNEAASAGFQTADPSTSPSVAPSFVSSNAPTSDSIAPSLASSNAPSTAATTDSNKPRAHSSSRWNPLFGPAPTSRSNAPSLAPSNVLSTATTQDSNKPGTHTSSHWNPLFGPSGEKQMNASATTVPDSSHNETQPPKPGHGRIWHSLFDPPQANGGNSANNDVENGNTLPPTRRQTENDDDGGIYLGKGKGGSSKSNIKSKKKSKSKKKNSKKSKKSSKNGKWVISGDFSWYSESPIDYGKAKGSGAWYTQAPYDNYHDGSNSGYSDQRDQTNRPTSKGSSSKSGGGLPIKGYPGDVKQDNCFIGIFADESSDNNVRPRCKTDESHDRNDKLTKPSRRTPGPASSAPSAPSIVPMNIIPAQNPSQAPKSGNSSPGTSDPVSMTTATPGSLSVKPTANPSGSPAGASVATTTSPLSTSNPVLFPPTISSSESITPTVTRPWTSSVPSKEPTVVHLESLSVAPSVERSKSPSIVPTTGVSASPSRVKSSLTAASQQSILSILPSSLSVAPIVTHTSIPPTLGSTPFKSLAPTSSPTPLSLKSTPATSNPTQTLLQAEERSIVVSSSPILLQVQGLFNPANDDGTFFDVVEETMKGYLISYIGQILDAFALNITFFDQYTKADRMSVVTSFCNVNVTFDLTGDKSALQDMSTERASSLVKALFGGTHLLRLMDSLRRGNLSVQSILVVEQLPPLSDDPEPANNDDESNNVRNREKRSTIYAATISGSLVLLAILFVLYQNKRRKERFYGAVQYVAESSAKSSDNMSQYTPTSGRGRIAQAALQARRMQNESQGSYDSISSAPSLSQPGNEANKGNSTKVSLAGNIKNTSAGKRSRQKEALIRWENGPDLVAASSLACIDGAEYPYSSVHAKKLLDAYPEFDAYTADAPPSPMWSIDSLSYGTPYDNDNDDDNDDDNVNVDLDDYNSQRKKWQDQQAEDLALLSLPHSGLGSVHSSRRSNSHSRQGSDVV